MTPSGAFPLYQHVFCLSHLRQRTSRYGQPFCSCRLTTAEGRYWSAYWWRAFPYRSIWPDGVEVRASVHPRRMGQKWILDIMALQLSDPADKGSQNQDVLVLPSWLLSSTPYPRLFRELWAQIHLFTSNTLREFNYRILHDPDISVSWVRIPASHAHHHAEAGGLLRHSVEAMRLLARVESMSLLEWEIARTALLWHDVGKILGYDQNGRRTMEGWTSAHDDATLEVLAPHLGWLRQRAPDLVSALKIHWSSRSTRPLMPGRILVEACDRMSAALDSRQQAFTDQSPRQQFAHLPGPGPSTRFWRPLISGQSTNPGSAKSASI